MATITDKNIIAEYNSFSTHFKLASDGWLYQKRIGIDASYKRRDKVAANSVQEVALRYKTMQKITDEHPLYRKMSKEVRDAIYTDDLYYFINAYNSMPNDVDGILAELQDHVHYQGRNYTFEDVKAAVQAYKLLVEASQEVATKIKEFLAERKKHSSVSLAKKASW